MDFFWTTVAALLTISVLSFLYKDNPFYKLAEHLFVGLAAGYIVCTEYHNVFMPNLWTPLMEGDVWMIVPLVLGAALFTRFSSNLSWVSRWPMSVIIGTYAGLAVIGFSSGDLVLQLGASMIPVFVPATASNFANNPSLLSLLQVLSNPIFTIGLVCVLFYFFFSVEQKGVLRHAATVGTTLLMIGFGAGYGYTVMTRIALLFDRFYFLFVEWLHIAKA
jgi:hypothetical protein